MAVEDEIAAGLRSFEVERELDKLAERVAQYAKGIAPVFGDHDPRRAEPPDGDPGAYRDSIRVTTTGPGRRRVGSDDRKAVWIEVGARHMPEYAVFTKTGARFGDTRGPILDEGVRRTQHALRGELERMAELVGSGASPTRIAGQKARVDAARQARASAFKAAHSRKRGGRRRRR